MILGNSEKQVGDIGLKSNNIFILVGMSMMWKQMKEYLYIYMATIHLDSFNIDQQNPHLCSIDFIYQLLSGKVLT